MENELVDRCARAWFANPQEARCAVHSTRTAAITCARCGGFHCELCVSSAAPTCCDRCGEIVQGERVPAMTRSVAWKLLLAPAFALVSGALAWHRHGAVPPIVLLWVAPFAAALLLVRTQKVVFGWLGVAMSLTVLAYQTSVVIDGGQLLRLTDVGMLAIAPLLAIHGCQRLASTQGRLSFALARS